MAAVAQPEPALRGFADAGRPPFHHEHLLNNQPAPILDLLGGATVFGAAPFSSFTSHELLAAGLPRAALIHLIDTLAELGPDAVLTGALGLSVRTLQRHREAPAQRLTPDQSSRLWTFADLLAKAIAVFGTRAAAERWLASPAVALDQRRPLDLLATSAGAAIVDTVLGRLEYGIYT